MHTHGNGRKPTKCASSTHWTVSADFVRHHTSKEVEKNNTHRLTHIEHTGSVLAHITYTRSQTEQKLSRRHQRVSKQKRWNYNSEQCVCACVRVMEHSAKRRKKRTNNKVQHIVTLLWVHTRRGFKHSHNSERNVNFNRSLFAQTFPCIVTAWTVSSKALTYACLFRACTQFQGSHSPIHSANGTRQYVWDCTKTGRIQKIAVYRAHGEQIKAWVFALVFYSTMFYRNKFTIYYITFGRL